MSVTLALSNVWCQVLIRGGGQEMVGRRGKVEVCIPPLPCLSEKFPLAVFQLIFLHMYIFVQFYCFLIETYVKDISFGIESVLVLQFRSAATAFLHLVFGGLLAPQHPAPPPRQHLPTRNPSSRSRMSPAMPTMIQSGV